MDHTVPGPVAAGRRAWGFSSSPSRAAVAIKISLQRHPRQNFGCAADLPRLPRQLVRVVNVANVEQRLEIERRCVFQNVEALAQLMEVDPRHLWQGRPYPEGLRLPMPLQRGARFLNAIVIMRSPRHSATPFPRVAALAGI